MRWQTASAGPTLASYTIDAEDDERAQALAGTLVARVLQDVSRYRLEAADVALELPARLLHCRQLLQWRSPALPLSPLS